MRVLETILIVLALISLWPLIMGYAWALTSWYKFGWLFLVLLAMAWVALRRMARIKAAADEARRKREEAERTGRPPWLP